MAPGRDSPKKRFSWTPEMNLQLLVAIINTLEPSTIKYAQIAEQLGDGHTRDTVYKRIYDIKKSRVNVGMASPQKSETSAPPPTPKKRKIAPVVKDEEHI